MNHQLSTLDYPEHQKKLDEWALAIGRFMVQFTSCEYWTYQYIKTFGSNRLRIATGDLMLKPRAQIAESLALEIGLVPEMQERVQAAFKNLSKLATSRNLVAHNGPMMHVYANAEGELLLEIELRSVKKDEQQLTIEQLNQLTAEARSLDEELALLYGEVRKKTNHAAVENSI